MIDSYRIIEATRDTRHAGDCCYFVVEFLEGSNVVCVEDFQMPNLKEMASVPVLDVAGDFVLQDGKKLKKKDIDDAQAAFLAAITGITDRVEIEKQKVKYLDPIDAKWKQVQRQTIPLDVAGTIEGNIERHIATLNSKGLRGDRRDKTMKPSDKQAIGISQRADVLMLRAKIKAVKNLTPIARVKL